MCPLFNTVLSEDGVKQQAHDQKNEFNSAGFLEVLAVLNAPNIGKHFARP